MPAEGDARRRPNGWELRASVTWETFKFLEAQARALGRSRTWHVGLVVESFAQAAQQLSDRDQARLDELLRHPEQLAELLRAGLR